METEIIKLREENKKLKEKLEFYETVNQKEIISV